jgi:hypothetical protein
MSTQLNQRYIVPFHFGGMGERFLRQAFLPPQRS